MKRLVAFLLLVMVSFVYCSTFALADEELRMVKVSEVTHSVFYAPQYVAVTLGFFEEEGLTIDLVNSQGADKVMTAVISGQVDIGFAGPESAIYVYIQGKRDYPQMFAQVTKRDGSFLVSRNPDEVGNFDWHNLKGSHVLPGRKGGAPYMAFEYAIKKNGLNPATDMNFDNSISFDAMTGAFVGGIGDYVTIFEPTATVLENEGRGYIVASIGEEAGEMPFTVYFANKSFIEENPELIQSFVNAIYKGQLWVHEHSAREVAEVLHESFAETDLEVLVKVVQRYKDIDAWNSVPMMTEESFNRLQDVIEGAGELERRVPFDVLVVNTYGEDAVQNVTFE